MNGRRAWCGVGAAWVAVGFGVTGCGGSKFTAAEDTGGAGGSAASTGGTAGATGGGSDAGGSAGNGGSSGSAGGSTGGTSSGSVVEACLAYTTATCEWQARCFGQRYYPSTDICFEQTRHYC